MAEKMNLRAGERRLLVVVALVVFVVVNIWFVFPHFGDVGRAKARRAAAVKKLAEYKAEIAQTGQREAGIKQLIAEEDVPIQDQAIELMQAIQRQASSKGVGLTGQSRQVTRTNEFFVEQSQTIVTQSSEDELIDFLYGLGSGNSTIRVRDLSVRPASPQRYELAATIELVSSYKSATPLRSKRANARTTANK